MNTKMNTVKIVTKISGDLLTITYRQSVPGEKFDATKHDTYGSQTFNIAELSETIKHDAILHGLKQKLVDNLAFTKEDKAKKTVQDATDMTAALWKQLTDGHWNAPSRNPKAPTIQLSDMEAKFLEGVKNGLTTYEQAATLYFSMTGKQLPPLTEEDENEEDTDEEGTDNNEN